jgi:hypothetical protein
MNQLPRARILGAQTLIAILRTMGRRLASGHPAGPLPQEILFPKK